MDAAEKREQDQIAYRQLKPMIDRTYPAGRLVAIHEGLIVADAATFEEIDTVLRQLGIPRPEGLVAQAGTPDMDDWFIFPVDYTL